MAANTKGLIYYKLDTDKYGYPGDITKNCGLRGEEVDSNFNFLRGQDIKEVMFDDNNLVIVKYDGEKLTAIKTPEAELPNYVFTYDKENGILTIIAPNKEETILSGFTPTVNIYTYHDYTLDGTGSLTTPLKLNENLMTGRYKPAIRLIDTTIVNDNGEFETLPSKNVAKHDRYVTKEKISKFGKLYPLTGVELIEKRLREINSEWRVPTKDDWNTIISIDETSGTALKAINYWEAYNNEILADDKYSFSVLPVGYAGNRGKDFYGSFGKETAFWTISKDNVEKESFVKLFKYDSKNVENRTWGENYLLSLRLVKDFKNNNFNNIEIIDGLNVTCVHIPGTELIWTKYNVGFSHAEYEGFTPEVWEDLEMDNNDIRYFINEWDGENWIKREMAQGEGVVLHNGKFGDMHEWLLKDNELVDITEIINIDVQNQITEIQNDIDDKIVLLTSNLETAVGNLEEKFTEAIENKVSSITTSGIAHNENVLANVIDTIEDKIVELSQKETEIIGNINNLELLSHQHDNKDIIDVIDNEKIDKWDNAEQNAINVATAHALSLNNAMNDRIVSLENDSHKHENFTTLNKINEVSIAKWNDAEQNAVGIANAYTDKEIVNLNNTLEREVQLLQTSAHTHTDYIALNRITNEKINVWDSVENEVKKYSDETFLRKDIAEATYVTFSRLSTQLRELSDRISILEGKMEQTISYIEGTGGEISVTKSGNVATVSFDPNAEFEATFEEE